MVLFCAGKLSFPTSQRFLERLDPCTGKLAEEDVTTLRILPRYCYELERRLTACSYTNSLTTRSQIYLAQLECLACIS